MNLPKISTENDTSARNRNNTVSSKFLRSEKSYEIKTNYGYSRYPEYKFVHVNLEILSLAGSVGVLLFHEIQNAKLGCDGYLHSQKKDYSLPADQKSTPELSIHTAQRP